MQFIKVILLSLFVSSNEIIKLKLVKKRTNFKIGENESSFLLDLEANFTCINRKHLNLPQTSQIISAHHYDVAYYGYFYTAVKAKDILKKNTSIILTEFNFYYFETFSTFYNKIGLGYYFNDKNLSIIYKAYKENKISKQQFGLEAIKDNNDMNNLYLGGFPNEYIQNKKFFNCKVEEKKSFWSCKLDTFIFNGIKYDVDKYAIIDNLDSNYLYCPTIFLREIMINNFPNFIRECHIKDFFQGMYLCPCRTFDNVKGVSIIINGYEVFIGKEEIIKEDKNNECALLIGTENEMFKNKWIIGEVFLNKFLTLFDYEKGEIIFYYTEKIILNINKQEKTLYIVNIWTLLVNIIIISIIVRINSSFNNKNWFIY